MPEFKQREEQRAVLKNLRDRAISEEVMARKEQSNVDADIPTIIMRDIRPWYSYMGFPLDAEGFPICLLYTSPSPRDRTRSRMPSSA